jgi:hypothetical protein
MRKKNIFYKDPLDQWLEDHPYLSTILAFVVIWGIIVGLITLSWGS